MNKSSQSPKATIESAGSILRTTRTAKGIPIEQVAHDLRMRPQQVLDLEQDYHSRLPHTSYVRLLMLYYAKYLDIPLANIELHLPERSNFQSGGYQTVCQQLPYRIKGKTVESPSSALPARVIPAISTCCILLIAIAVSAGIYFSLKHSREEQNRLKPPSPVGAVINTEAEIAKKPSPTVETMRTFDSALLERVPRLTPVNSSPLRLAKSHNLVTKSELVRNASKMSFLTLPQQVGPEKRVLKALSKQDSPLRE